MAKKKEVEVVRKQQNTSAHRVAVAGGKSKLELDREEFSKEKAKAVPKLVEDFVRFEGAGVQILKVFKADPSDPSKKVEKKFAVDFGQNYTYMARDKDLIAEMKKLGYKILGE